MIVIGEKLNSSIPSTWEAMQSGDTEKLTAMIRRQEECGADYLDINTAMFGEEEKAEMVKLVSLAMENSSCGIMLDSPSPDVIAYVLPLIKDRPVIVNSVTLCERVKGLAPLIAECGAGVVAMPSDENGIPAEASQRIENACRLIEILSDYGIAEENIYVDCICEALAVGDTNAKITLDTIRGVQEIHPSVKTVCGLSNVSFGLPKRIFINTAFLCAALYAGLDGAIMDCTSEKMTEALKSAEAVIGKDEYCMNYIEYVREKYL